MPRRGYRKGLHDSKEPLPHFVRTRLNDQRFAALLEEAKSRGVTVSTLTRLVLCAHLQGQRADLPQRRGEDAALLRQLVRIGNNLNQLAHQANAGLVPIRQEELRACLDRINMLARVV